MQLYVCYGDRGLIVVDVHLRSTGEILRGMSSLYAWGMHREALQSFF